MYDTITIEPVHTGWWFLLFMAIVPAVIIYVWLSARMNNDKISAGAGYVLQSIVAFGYAIIALIAIGIPLVHTPSVVTDNQESAMVEQLHYKNVSIEERGNFTASTEDGMYISGILVDDGDNVYTISYLVEP